MKGEISDEKEVTFSAVVCTSWFNRHWTNWFYRGSDYDQRMDNMMNECTNFMQSFDDNNENK